MVELALRQMAADEAELVERARRKDRAAIRMIVKQQNQRLYRIARSIVKDDSEAEDVLQEAYVHAFGNLDAFRGEARFGTWLARIVINEALSLVRRRKPTSAFGLQLEDSPLAASIIPFPQANPQLDPERAVAQREFRALVERAIDRLPQAFRAVLVARLIEGMSVEETAELFAIPPQTVKTRLHRARALVRRDMEQHFGPALGNAFPFLGRRCDRLTDAVLERLGPL